LRAALPARSRPPPPPSRASHAPLGNTATGLPRPAAPSARTRPCWAPPPRPPACPAGEANRRSRLAPPPARCATWALPQTAPTRRASSPARRALPARSRPRRAAPRAGCAPPGPTPTCPARLRASPALPSTPVSAAALRWPAAAAAPGESARRHCALGARHFTRRSPCPVTAATKGSKACVVQSPPLPPSCLAGSGFSAETGKCAQCGLGEYQPKAGQVGCLQCLPGTYQDRKGRMSCKPCPVKYYMNYPGQDYCKSCPGGPRGERRRRAAAADPKSCPWCSREQRRWTEPHLLPVHHCTSAGVTGAKTCPSSQVGGGMRSSSSGRRPHRSPPSTVPPRRADSDLSHNGIRLPVFVSLPSNILRHQARRRLHAIGRWRPPACWRGVFIPSELAWAPSPARLSLLPNLLSVASRTRNN
jgi:hypothetical protein